MERQLSLIVFVVGYGSIGKRHCNVIADLLPQAKIYIVHHKCPDDDDNDDCGGSSTNHCIKGIEGIKGFEGVFHSYTDALNSSLIPDMVFICNPSPCHVSTAYKFSDNPVKKPKGIFIEKPFSNTTEMVEELIEHCRVNSIVLQIGYQLRFSILKTVKTILDDPTAIGNVCSVQINFGEYLPGWRNGTDYTKGVTANEKLGGGVLLEISHELDYLTWLFGEPCEIIGCSVGRRGNLNIDVEDTVDVLLKYDSFTTNVHIDMLDRLKHRSLKIVTTGGSILWSAPNDTVTGCYTLKVATDAGVTVYNDLPRNDLMKLQLQHFISKIDNRDFECKINGLSALKLVEQIKNR